MRVAMRQRRCNLFPKQTHERKPKHKPRLLNPANRGPNQPIAVVTTLGNDLIPLVAADSTSDHGLAGSGVSPIICQLGPESLLQHPRKRRPLCNTLWPDSGIGQRSVCVTFHSLAATHVFANHRLSKGKPRAATLRRRSVRALVPSLVGVMAWPSDAELTSAPTPSNARPTNAPACSVCGATSQLHRRCLACLGVAGSCLPAEQPPISARAVRQMASGGAGRPDETKAACKGNSAAPSLRGLRSDGFVEASCAKATSSMPESEPNAAWKKRSLSALPASWFFGVWRRASSSLRHPNP